MPIKDILRKKLPSDVKESPEFNVLLKLIEKKKISSIAGLGDYLESEIKKTRKWLAENRVAGTISDERREKVRELEFLEIIKSKVMKYL